MPRDAFTVSLPAPVLRLFETVPRFRVSLPAPVLMLTRSLVVSKLLSLPEVELRETSFRPSVLFVLAVILKLPVQFKYMY